MCIDFLLTNPLMESPREQVQTQCIARRGKEGSWQCSASNSSMLLNRRIIHERRQRKENKGK